MPARVFCVGSAFPHKYGCIGAEWIKRIKSTLNILRIQPLYSGDFSDKTLPIICLQGGHCAPYPSDSLTLGSLRLVNVHQMPKMLAIRHAFVI